MNTAISAGCAPAPFSLEAGIGKAGWREALADRADPAADYWRTMTAYNAGDIENEANEAAYMAALHRIDRWAPPTCRDFVRKFVCLFIDGGMPTQERLGLLLAQAKGILAQPGTPDSFALAWLDQWRAAGGWAVIEASGGLALGMAEADGPHDSYEAGAHDVRARALLDLLAAVPGGREAVKALVIPSPAPEAPPTPQARAAEWLALWEAGGGGWTVIGGAPMLCCPVRDAKPGLRISDAMTELGRLGLRDAVLAEVLRRSAPLSVEA